MNYNVLNYPEEDINRFWSKVKVIYNEDGTPDFNACMDWTGRTFKHGYGAFDFMYRSWYAHRFSYTCFNGKIPDTLCICHTCDNKVCVNPYHLWLGTIQENNQDRDNKCRQNKGEGVITAKFTEQSIEQMLTNIYHNKYSNVKDICREYNCGEPLIREILQGYHWKHIIGKITSKLETTIVELHDKIIAKTMKGSDNGFSKLNEDEVKSIKIRLRNKESGLKIAKDYNVDHTVIYKIKNNRAWKHVQI